MRSILYLIIILTLFSCDIINPEEEIPAFLEMESFELTVTPNNGTADQNITEGWVYVNNDLIGAFSAGKPFPVLASGTVEIIVDPGVHENGIGFTPSLYPYYTRYTTTLELTPGQTTTFTPEFEYREDIEFVSIEEFENTSIFTVDRDGNEETTIEYTTEGAFEGFSAKIELDNENPFFEMASNITWDLPIIGANETWMEINFKTDMPFALGLLTQDPATGVITPVYLNGLNRTAEWRKVYINFQETIAAIPVPPFQLGFIAELPTDQASGTIFIDNVKLLHFKE